MRPQLPSEVGWRVVRAAADASGFHRLLQLLGIHSRKLVPLLLVAVVLGVALKRQHPRNRALATPEACFLDERFEPIGRARVDADARDLIGALLRVGRSFGRRGLLAGGLVPHRSPAPLVERPPPVLLARGQGQHAEEGLHARRVGGLLCCPGASAANQGCPAAKVRMLWVHRRRLSTVYPLLWLSFGSGPPRFASGIKDTRKGKLQIEDKLGGEEERRTRRSAPGSHNTPPMLTRGTPRAQSGRPSARSFATPLRPILS